jgi:hypothetical protein
MPGPFSGEDIRAIRDATDAWLATLLKGVAVNGSIGQF